MLLIHKLSLWVFWSLLPSARSLNDKTFTMSNSNTGTVRYLESGGLIMVDYPATAYRDVKYTIEETLEGTIYDLPSAQIITTDAIVSLTYQYDTNKKRSLASWALPTGPSHLSQNNQLSSHYPGRTEAFSVPDPADGRRRLAVACGSTKLVLGDSKASVLVLTKNPLGPYPVSEAEYLPITN